MPYEDPDQQREAARESARRRRQGGTIDALAERVKDAAGLPDPPSREALLRVLGVLAMSGSVTAIRMLLEEYRRVPNTRDSLAVVDDLAARRASNR